MRFASLAVLRTQSDERLVALARAGSEPAFEAIVERYRRPLLRHARKLLTATAAEDAVQQALLSSWTALRRGDDVRELSAWLHRILHNVALNALRDAGLECVELPDSVTAGNTPEDEIERRMDMRRTLAGMAALPEHQREAVLRMAVQGRSQADVAQALGLSRGAVAQLVLRARRTLRAAATTLTPQGLLQWLSTLGSEGQPAATRVAELAGGGGAVGLSLGKLAAIVAVAGTAATGPALTDRRDDSPRQRVGKRTELVLVEPEPVRRDRPGTSRPAIEPGVGGAGETRGPSSGDGRAGSSGPGSGGSESGGSGSLGSGTSGSGSLGSGSSGSGTSGSGTSGSGTSVPDDSTSGSSGSGTSVPDGSTSGSSGSGSSGSGSSGTSGSGTSTLDYSTSGSSGSGSSGSGSSGSGTSGPGSGDPS